MAEYIQPGFDSDPDSLALAAFTYIQERIDGWAPASPHIETILIEALAGLVAEAIAVASDVPPAIFRYFGKLVGVLPLEASVASADSTWTMVDNAGYTIPAGTAVAVGPDDLVFKVQSDVVVPVGSTTTAVGGVVLVADETGEAGSGLSSPVRLVDALDYVDDVVIVGTTTGGVDAETDDDYLDRLSDQLRLMAPRPILPEDFATMARRTAGVARALALDGYNPTAGTFGHERYVTVAIQDESGLALSGAIKTAVSADLEAMREVNFVVPVIDPTYTTVYVTFTADSYPGYDPASVEAAAEAAVAAYLDPARWGLPDYGDQPLWLNEPLVRRLELAAVLDRVEGLRHVLTLTLKAGSAPASGDTADVALTGAAPLPLAGTINGTVS